MTGGVESKAIRSKGAVGKGKGWAGIGNGSWSKRTSRSKSRIRERWKGLRKT